MAGVSLADIADLMGHRDLATTQIYAKVAQEHLRVAAGKLASLIEATSRVALPAKFADRSVATRPADSGFAESVGSWRLAIRSSGRRSDPRLRPCGQV